MAGPGFAGQHQDAGRRQGQAPRPRELRTRHCGQWWAWWSVAGCGPHRLLWAPGAHGAPAVPKEALGMARADRKSSPGPREEQAASTVLTLLCWASPAAFSPRTNKSRASHIMVTTKSHHFCSYPFKHKERENDDISCLIQAYHFCLQYCHFKKSVQLILDLTIGRLCYMEIKL